MRIQAMVSSIKARLQGASGEEAVPDATSVQAAELAVILGSGTAVDPATVQPWGLALSGGGIRSATFCLGVLQALARNGLLGCFHYQSTVSGGGYIGGFLQALIHRHGHRKAFEVLGAPPPRASGETDTDADPPHAPPTPGPSHPIRHLREYSNYLSPRKSPFSGDTLGMVGTYVRNVLLIQLQLCALILAVTLLPLVLHLALVGLARAQPVLTPSLAGLVGMLAVALLAYVTTYDHKRARALGTPVPTHVALFALLAIWLLALAAFISAVGLAHYQHLQGAFGRLFAWLPFGAVGQLAIASGALYFLMWMGWLLFDRWQSGLRPEGTPASAMQQHPLRFVAATFATSVFAGFAILRVQVWLTALHARDPSEWLLMILGPSLTMTAVVLTGILHLGLAGPALSDLQREIWARVGGKTAALVVLGMTLSLALTVYGPWLLMRSFTPGAIAWNDIGWTGILTWLSTTVVGVMAGRGKSAGGDADASLPGRAFDLVARIAPWVFILGLIVALGLGGQALLWRFDGHPAGATSPWQGSMAAYLAWLAGYPAEHGGVLAATIAIAAATWLLLAMAVNVNEFSLNAFYRNRLVRCYLGASNAWRNPEPTTNFDVADDLPLHRLVEGAPMADGARPLFPLICTALNLVAAKQLDWQDRKAASFCLTPGFCGYLPPVSRAGAAVVGDTHADIAGTARAPRDGEALASSLTLGSAIAISGAAVNPNMGYHSSPAVTFLLTLFDARLGWWLPNPSHATRPRSDKAPFFGRWLLAELFGRTHEGGRDVHLSDGGHFENLGLYELVRRRCRFILCVDAAADPRRGFADLGNAVQKCRVDFDVEIRIDTGALRAQADGLALRSCAVGDVLYPDGSRGTLLYLKPTLTGEEPTDIQHYASAHPSFPHEPTSDQFFDEAQFESYRRLGLDVASRAIEPVLERAGANVGALGHDDLNLLEPGPKETLLLVLRQQWAEALPGGTARFAQHAAMLSQLFARLREAPELAVLDAQFHPAWTDLVPPDPATLGTDAARPVGRRTRLPAPEHFRACFYFCQELTRLMEAVYHDLDFERAWDHPDHRGWMNAFRQWSGAPMFRVAWAMSAPTFGSRFVAFCERRLDLPRLDNEDKDLHALSVIEVSPGDGDTWARHCDTLADAGRINHVEHAILRSDAMLKGDAARPTRLFLLQLRWRSVLSRTGNRIPDTTLGVAALSGTTLRLLRVQDHVRRMGLGAEFMRLLIERPATVVEVVDVRGGHYGLAGICRNRVAADVTRRLEALRTSALRRRQERNDARRRARAARPRREDAADDVRGPLP